MAQPKKFIITFLLSLIAQYASAQQCEMSFDEKSGLFSVSSNSKALVTTYYGFWGENWRWAGAKTETETVSPKNYSFNSSVDLLRLSFSGTAKASEPNQLNWNYSFNAAKDIENVVGGGIVFRLNPDPKDNVDIELLPDNMGWSMYGDAGCQRVIVRFSEPVKNIYFERGNKGQIRAFFYDKQVDAGVMNNSMSVSLPLDAHVTGTIAEQLGGEPDPRWHKDMLQPTYSPVDLSYLNKDEIPAGKHGFLKAEGENLVFEDGKLARFWGTNIQAYALFSTSPSQIKEHAKRLSKLGFNLVRFHHHDSNWVNPNIFGNKAPDTLTLNATSFKMLDLWIKALKDEGIYVWLDLNVGREFSKNDGIENFDEFAKGKDRLSPRGYNYVDEDIEKRMEEFNDQYLNHVNEYTGLAYKDDPAIINMLITNENDLTHHFGNALLPDKNVPTANKKYTELANSFADKNNLPRNKVWRSWETGSPKIFLNDLEHQFNVTQIKHLQSIGVKSLISTTNSWGAMPLYSLPALTDSTLIDTHSYGRIDYFKANPRVKDNFISWIGAAQVNGKPVANSEWNIERFPDTFDRFSSPVYLAAVSALQGWDALMQYGYSQQPLNNEGRPSNYTTFNDPASMVMMPVAALIYRQGHVSGAKKTYALSLDKKTFYGKSISPSSSAAIRTLMEQSKLVIDIPKTDELPWLNTVPLDGNVIKVTDENRDFIPEGQNFIRSDTGELTRDWVQGVYTINTPRSQAALGWIGDKNIELENIKVQFDNKNAAVAVQSLDNKPLSSSENILITLATRTEPSPGNKMPFLSEPASGTIMITASAGLKLYLINKYGKQFDMPVSYENGSYKISIDEKLDSYWLALKK
ncbi:MAG: glycosyl hydrolase family 5 [Kordiimonadaceae bacterium]|nr:glycosyl hydrolase family 5 [Kordiimonadaceae bacterium]